VADLDSLKRNWSTQTVADTEDIENDNGRVLIHYGGRSDPSIASVGTGSAAYSTCESASGYGSSLEPKPAIGMRFCVQTDENRYSVITIKRLDLHQDGGVDKYVFDVKTRGT
jgi:hypothetical protein